VAYAILTVEVVVQTVLAFFGEDFLGVVGVVMGGGIILIVCQVYVLASLAHVSLGRRALAGDATGYRLAVALLVFDVLHFGAQGWFRLGPAGDVTWVSDWVDHEASTRRQGVVLMMIAAAAVIGLVSLVRWKRSGVRSRPKLPHAYARLAAVQALLVSVMLGNGVVANEVLQNRRVAIRLDGARDAVDEQVRWSFTARRADGFRDRITAVTQGGGRVYVAGDAGRLTALNRSTGGVVWSEDVGTGIYGLAFGGGNVYASYYELVIAFDAATGKERWRLGAAGEESTCVVEPPVADDSAVYVIASKRTGVVTQMVAVDASTGRERWRFSWSGHAFCAEDPTAVVGGGLVVLSGAGAGDGLTALDVDTGRVRWRMQLGAWPEWPSSVEGDAAYALTRAGVVSAVDLQSGDVRWTKDLGLGARGPIVANDGVVFVEDGGMVALDASSGEERWRFRSTEEFTPPAIPGDRSVFAAIALGTYVRVHSVDRATGREVACVLIPKSSSDMEAFGSAESAVLVANGEVFAVVPEAQTPEVIRTLRDVTPDDPSCPVVRAS